MHRRILTPLLLAALLTGFVATPAAEELLRDPTRPYVASAKGTAAAAGFAVNAIIVSPERRIAIVNGRRVAVGGKVHGATVVSIEKDHLILEKDGKRITAGPNVRASR